MKIRLIQPSQLTDNGSPARYQKLFLPFLTLPTLAGMTPSGIDVAITEDYVEDINYDEDVDLVGITSQTCQAPRAYQISDEFRKRGTKTVLGGIHASVCTDEAMQHFDSVLVGEGEILWKQILDDAAAGRLKKVYRQEEKVELSDLVIPRFDLLDFNNYVIPPFSKTPLIPIQTTRGCPHRCDFCSVSSFLGQKIRKKPVANVMKEIEAVAPSRIFFSDDNIVGDVNHARELFKAMIPLKMRWACQMDTRINQYPELIDLAAESGCHETFIGVESLNPATLAAINKGFNKTGEYKDMFRRLRQAGIIAQASLVFGLDGDTIDDLKRTIDAVMEWDINYLYVNVLTPFPGTKLYEQMKSQGRMLSDDWSKFDIMHSVVEFKSIKSDELWDSIWQLYREFYSAKNIWKRVWRYRREYTAFFPRDFAIEEVFFQYSMRKAVQQGAHPFSLGLKDQE